MPLKPGKENIGYNLTELKEANKDKVPGKKRSLAQRLAIALSTALGRKKEKK